MADNKTWLDKSLAHDRIRKAVAKNLKLALPGRCTFLLSEMLPSDAATTLRQVVSYSGLTDSEINRIANGLANDVLHSPGFIRKLRIAVDPKTERIDKVGKAWRYYTPKCPATDYTGLVPTGYVLIPAVTKRDHYAQAITKVLDAQVHDDIAALPPMMPPATDLTMPNDAVPTVTVPTEPAPLASVDLNLRLDLTVDQLIKVLAALKD